MGWKPAIYKQKKFRFFFSPSKREGKTSHFFPVKFWWFFITHLFEKYARSSSSIWIIIFPGFGVIFFFCLKPPPTLPKTNSLPLKISHPNRKLVYSNHSFSGANLLLVSGRVFCSITLGLVGKRHPNRFFQANVWKNGKISGWMAQAIWTTTFLPVLCCHDSFSPFKPFWHATQRKVKFPVSVNLSSEAHGD